jgi:hypothetical protein
LRDRIGHRILVAQIRDDCACPRSAGCEFRDDRARPLGIDIDAGDRRAVARESAGERAAESEPRTGYERDATGEVEAGYSGAPPG